MNHIQEKQAQIKANWEKILRQSTIYKADILRIYNQVKGLADMDDQFKPFKNSMNTQVNGMKSGILTEPRKANITALCAQYLITTEG
jgi:hypothetical protein